jgi:hypothetical protein
LPWTGLATLFAAIYYAKKASSNKARADAKDAEIAALGIKLKIALDEVRAANATINHMSEVYSELDKRPNWRGRSHQILMLTPLLEKWLNI